MNVVDRGAKLTSSCRFKCKHAVEEQRCRLAHSWTTFARQAAAELSCSLELKVKLVRVTSWHNWIPCVSAKPTCKGLHTNARKCTGVAWLGP